MTQRPVEVAFAAAHLIPPFQQLLARLLYRPRLTHGREKGLAAIVLTQSHGADVPHEAVALHEVHHVERDDTLVGELHHVSRYHDLETRGAILEALPGLVS